jgi:hypothetical protein
MANGAGLTRDAVALTQRAIDALRPAISAYRVPDKRCVGLAVRVAPSGVKIWLIASKAPARCDGCRLDAEAT